MGLYQLSFKMDFKAMLGLFFGAVCISFAPILVKAVDLGPDVIGFYRCLVGAIVLGSVAFVRSGFKLGFKKKDLPKSWPLLIVAGVLFALDLAVWHRSVFFAGAGMSTILGNTQVFYLGLVGLLLHKEKFSWRYGLSVPVAFVGLYLLVTFQQNTESLPNYWWGIFYGLLTGVVYASFILTLRKGESEGSQAGTVLNLAVVCVVAACGLFVLAGLAGEISLPKGVEWVWLLLLGLVSQVVGWLLITANLPKVPVSISGLIILTQPSLAAIWGAIIYKEELGWIQILGAGLTFVGIYLGSTRKLSN